MVENLKFFQTHLTKTLKPYSSRDARLLAKLKKNLFENLQ